MKVSKKYKKICSKWGLKVRRGWKNFWKKRSRRL